MLVRNGAFRATTLDSSQRPTSSRTTIFDPTLKAQLCALEAALKNLKEEAIKDRQYFLSRFDDIVVTLSQVVTALGDIQGHLHLHQSRHSIDDKCNSSDL